MPQAFWQLAQVFCCSRFNLVSCSRIAFLVDLNSDPALNVAGALLLVETFAHF